VIGGIWRWAWTAGVFGLFFVVVGTALEGAPSADGELPLIEPGAAPIKERVALPDLDQVVPRSSVLNLLAEGDDPDAVAPEALAALQQGLDEENARVGERAPVAAGTGPADASAEPPFAGRPTPDRRPATVPQADTADRTDTADTADTESEPELAARRDDGTFRIQLAAVPAGEEQTTFERLERRFGEVLDGLAPRFHAVSTDDGVLVRVQVAGFASEAAASARCARIRAAGGDCFVVVGPG
jgi:hypothetical protein